MSKWLNHLGRWDVYYRVWTLPAGTGAAGPSLDVVLLFALLLSTSCVVVDWFQTREQRQRLRQRVGDFWTSLQYEGLEDLGRKAWHSSLVLLTRIVGPTPCSIRRLAFFTQSELESAASLAWHRVWDPSEAAAAFGVEQAGKAGMVPDADSSTERFVGGFGFALGASFAAFAVMYMAAVVVGSFLAWTIGPHIALLAVIVTVFVGYLVLKAMRPLIEPTLSMALARVYESERGVLTLVGVVVGGTAKLIEEILERAW